MNSTIVSTLALAVQVSRAVPNHIDISRDAPPSSHHSCVYWVAKTRDQERGDERGVILDEIGVCSLSAVEAVGCMS